MLMWKMRSVLWETRRTMFPSVIKGIERWVGTGSRGATRLWYVIEAAHSTEVCYPSAALPIVAFGAPFEGLKVLDVWVMARAAKEKRHAQQTFQEYGAQGVDVSARSTSGGYTVQMSCLMVSRRLDGETTLHPRKAVWFRPQKACGCRMGEKHLPLYMIVPSAVAPCSTSPFRCFEACLFWLRWCRSQKTGERSTRRSKRVLIDLPRGCSIQPVTLKLTLAHLHQTHEQVGGI